MATLKHAFLSRAVGLKRPSMEIQTIQDILLGDSVMVQSFPWHTTVILGFWAAGEPNETFTWTAGVAGTSSNPFRLPSVSVTIPPNGEICGTAQIPLDMSEPGVLAVTLTFGQSIVWTRRALVHSAGSQLATIQ